MRFSCELFGPGYQSPESFQANRKNPNAVAFAIAFPPFLWWKPDAGLAQNRWPLIPTYLRCRRTGGSGITLLMASGAISG